MTNLELLREAEKGLRLDDMHRFDAYMLGALSVLVSPETWQKVLSQALYAAAAANTPKEPEKL